MAYDKVVDSSVLDAGLTQIANAIREKAGTSDNLAFPTAMAEAIAAIQAGGGGGIQNLKYVCGEITPADDISTTYTLATSSDMSPLLNEGENYSEIYKQLSFLMWQNTLDAWVIEDMKKSFLACLVVSSEKSTGNSGNAVVYVNSSGTRTRDSISGSGAQTTSVKVNPNSNYPLRAGRTYFWIVVRGR